jgi:hypothetical protein
MARYHSMIQEYLNALRVPASLSKGDLVYAHKPDAKRGKICARLDRALRDCRVPLGQ